MTIRHPKFLAGRVAVAALLLGSALGARADVVNGGFETGDFSGWTTSGLDANFDGVDVNSPQSGAFAAFFGNPAGGSTISQSVATVAGEFYRVFFWLKNEADPLGASAPNSFEFNWDDGAAEMTLTDAPNFGYQKFSFDLQASGTSTNISFSFGHGPAFWDLDNVTIPEPGSFALAGLAMGLAAMSRRRRKA